MRRVGSVLSRLRTWSPLIRESTYDGILIGVLVGAGVVLISWTDHLTAGILCVCSGLLAFMFAAVDKRGKRGA